MLHKWKQYNSVSKLESGTAGTPVLGLQGVDMSTPVVDPPPIGSDTADEGVEKPQGQSADEALPAISPDATDPDQVLKDTAGHRLIKAQILTLKRSTFYLT